MATKAEFITQLKAEYPTLRTGSDEEGYTDLTPAEYEAKISEWADAQIAQEAIVSAEQIAINARASRNAKLAKMGFTAAEIDNW